MQYTLDDQSKEIKREKEKLQNEHNVNFYLQKIKELNNQLSILNEKKNLILQNNEKLKLEHNDQELNFQYDIPIKNNILEDQILSNNNTNIINSSLRSKSKSQPKKKNNIISVNETIKSTLENFNKLGGVELQQEKNINSYYEKNNNL